MASSCRNRSHVPPSFTQKNAPPEPLSTYACPEIIPSATAARCPLSSSLSDSAFLTASSAPSLLRSSSLGLPENEILSLACRISFSILSWPGTSVCRDEYLHSCQSGVPFLRNSLHLTHQSIMVRPPRSSSRIAFGMARRRQA